jgi:hypothetical protein
MEIQLNCLSDALKHPNTNHYALHVCVCPADYFYAYRMSSNLRLIKRKKKPDHVKTTHGPGYKIMHAANLAIRSNSSFQVMPVLYQPTADETVSDNLACTRCLAASARLHRVFPLSPPVTRWHGARLHFRNWSVKPTAADSRDLREKSHSEPQARYPFIARSQFPKVGLDQLST